eukprot:4053765-Amphidinium_carterae.1
MSPTQAPHVKTTLFPQDLKPARSDGTRGGRKGVDNCELPNEMELKTSVNDPASSGAKMV